MVQIHTDTNGQSEPGPKICIVGAGMGGLTCALALAKQGLRNIEVFEMASNLGFVGAGIQLAPNMARILDKLGVWSDIEKQAVILRDTTIRDGPSDNELAHVKLDYIHNTYGYHHMVGHRHSLANGIYQGCLREKTIEFNFSTTISNITSFTDRPTFTATPRNGTPYSVTADILLGCDGVKSQIRDTMLQDLDLTHTAKIIDTNQAAYRIMLKRSDMESDPDLLQLIDSERVTRWVGPRRHIIAYPVSNKQIYNISTAQPDTHFAAAPSATYTTKGSKSAMLQVYSDFNPTVLKLLNLVPEGELCEWKLRVHSPLPTWVHGSTALVGDACHPTLPHLAQGAAQAIEDAAVLAAVISKIPSLSSSPSSAFTPHNIRTALLVYEAVRKDRAETLVDLAGASGRALHLDEGDSKTERDRLFAETKSVGAEGGGRVPDKWADREVQKMIYGVDVLRVVEEGWEGFVREVGR